DGADTAVETGWSVLVRGVAREVTDVHERARLARLPLHPWAPGERDRWLRVVPTSVTGRAISRPRANRAGGLRPPMSTR
ncbi:MAG TPA: pyridoxamine 5'-phosphate oxidase family protein, partial [Candidatus Limnocylindria bacterium]|nr:pyridoxamine 5'-phosphate oxidase family protein [Candidatus Limnocylindria bacterium]